MNGDGQPIQSRIEDVSCELCILGAGAAGLNALYAASRYLGRNQKVVLVDRNATAGGMWLSTYDYVRLHQPRAMFTAGDITWSTGLAPDHLASRAEVASHLTHCLETLSKRVALDTRFGYEYCSHEEAAGTDEVLVHCASTTGASALRVRAKKLIKAFGANVATKAPLRLSSQQVRSISPDQYDVCSDELSSSDAPVYIIGGGKTSMDTAYALITRSTRKRVSLVIGSGVMFGRRDTLYPKGLRRYWSGDTPVDLFLDLAGRFDGHNEDDVLDRLRSKYTVSVVPDARRFMLGLLSEHENSVIRSGTREIIRGYLVDVIDRDGRPTLLLDSGEARLIEPGSWIVNCTGYLLQESVPYEPFVSPSGKVVSIQPSSTIQASTLAAAYFAVHLSYLNKLTELPLYELDFVALYRANRDVLAAVLGTHTLYNALISLGAVPRRVVNEFGADNGRWFPFPRRLYDGIRVLRYQKRNPDHFRRALDAVRERFNLRCGPLPALGVDAHTAVGWRSSAARVAPPGT